MIQNKIVRVTNQTERLCRRLLDTAIAATQYNSRKPSKICYIRPPQLNIPYFRLVIEPSSRPSKIGNVRTI